MESWINNRIKSNFRATQGRYKHANYSDVLCSDSDTNLFWDQQFSPCLCKL